MKFLEHRIQANKITTVFVVITLVISFVLANTRIAFGSTLTNGMNASYVLGQVIFTVNAITTTINATTIGSAHEIAFDETNDRLFVSDTGSDRVLVFDISGGITNGMNASYVLGQTSMTAEVAGAVTQNTFSRPTGLVYDEVNNYLFVVDNGANRVMVFDVSSISNNENAIYVLGQSNFTSSDTATTQSGMNDVTDVAVDSTNEKLFVSENGNKRVLVYEYSGGITNGMNASYVLGQVNFTSNDSAVTKSGMSGPESLAFDPTGERLFVVESGSNRVLVFNTETLL